ncbi:F-box domain-containing protein [Hirschfeldia incana]|nr:F-box domain-containing protein [Hirschfeldia incana]
MPKQLPRDLVGDILCLLPLKSLARFRAVCKEWNSIWEDKSFSNHYLCRTRPQFMVATAYQTFSIEIILNEEDHVLSSIVERDITLEYPCETHTSLGYCDGFLLFCMHKKGFAIWNPWVRQNKFIENEEFKFCGIGYDNLTGYKIFGLKSFYDSSGENNYKVAIYECRSDVWKFINDTGLEPRRLIMQDNIVSIKGNLYVTAIDSKTRESFLQSFDFSEDKFKTICGNLPSMEGCYTGILAVFRGDRVSLLMQSEEVDMKVEILVSKQRVDEYGEVLVWINFMTVSIPNFPSLQPNIFYPRPTYFVDGEKRLFVCTFDETEHLCIYIVKGDVRSKIPIDYVFDIFLTSYMSYIPSFISIPCVSKEMS